MEFHEEPGPVYGNQKLPKSLPLVGTLMQACPDRDELEFVRAFPSERVVAAYEVAINHLLGLVETMKRIAELADESKVHIARRPIGHRMDAIAIESREALGMIGE